MSKLANQISQYQNALTSFADVLRQEKNEYLRDSAIKRFELIFDLSWKLIKTFLEEQGGVICASPKICFREAFKQNLIAYDEYWIELTNLRNQSTHLYNEKMAEEIYEKLPEALKYFEELFRLINEKIKKA